MARITAWVTRNSQRTSARRRMVAPTTQRKATENTRMASVRRRFRVEAASPGGGGSTPPRGSTTLRSLRIAGQHTSTPNRITKGIDGVRFSWNGRSHPWSAVQRGRNVLKRAMKTPSPSPPKSALGRLARRPTAAAAIATMTRWKKSGAMRVLKRGAINTPAIPANRLDSAHAKADTRSALIPFNSVIRGLSTTARSANPSELKRNKAPRAAMPTRATAIWANSSRLSG